MAVAILIPPIYIMGFSLSMINGKWLIYAISNGGFSIPVNGNYGVLEFDTFEECRKECLLMNKEHEIEIGN